MPNLPAMPQDSATKPKLAEPMKPLLPGTYGAKGDSWTYTIGDDGSITVKQPGGKPVKIDRTSHAGASVLEQINSGQLSLGGGNPSESDATRPTSAPASQLSTPLVASSSAYGESPAGPVADYVAAQPITIDDKIDAAVNKYSTPQTGLSTVGHSQTGADFSRLSAAAGTLYEKLKAKAAAAKAAAMTASAGAGRAVGEVTGANALAGPQ